MRFLLGWALKIAIVGVIYIGVTGGLSDLNVPDTVFGYKVPEGVKRGVQSTAKLKEYGAETSDRFKKIADSISR